MGLFDSIRRTLGGGDDAANEESESADSASEPASDGPTVTDSTALSPTEFRQRAETVADRSADLDFSTDSLSRLDAAVAEQFAGEPVAEGEDTAYTTHTVRFGSYLGEVLVRDLDGRWVQDDGWAVTVAGADDERTVAVFDVAARSFADEPVFAAVLDRLETELTLGADADEQSEDVGETTASDEGTDSGAGWAGTDDWQPATEKAGFDATTTSDGSDQPGSEPDDTAEAGGVADTEGGSDAEGGAADASDAGDDPPEDGFQIPDAEGGVAAAGGTTHDEPADDPGSEAATDDPTPETDAWSLAARSDAEFDEGGGDDSGRQPAVDADSDEPLLDQMADDDPADPTAGDGLRADHAERAIEFADFWGEHDLDLTPASLARLDDLVDTEWEDDRFADATYGATDSFDDRSFTSLVEEMGSYFGEVLVRDLDGEWTDETDHDAAVVVTGPDGPLAVPVSEVAIGAIRDDGSFEHSYDALLADVGD